MKRLTLSIANSRIERVFYPVIDPAGHAAEVLREARTIGAAHNVLRYALGKALRNNAVSRNVALLVSPPKIEDAEMEILEPSDIDTVLKAIDCTMLHPIASLALATGMRRGELLALQWGDIDLEGGTLTVERSVEETRAGLRLKPPKSKKGRRSIALNPGALALLRKLRLERMELNLVIGRGRLTDDMHVFTDLDGNMLGPRSVSDNWRKTCVAKGIPPVPFHSLRHTHVSILINAGVDILTISRRLGHSKASITLDVYGHLIKGSDSAAASAIAKVLG